MLALLSASQPAQSQTADPEGPTRSGLNDSLSTAVAAGQLPFSSALLILGWIDSGNANDVDFYEFDVTSLGTLVYLDVDLTDDLLNEDDLDDGLDTALWIFDSAGRLIAQNDDADFFGLEIDNDATDPGSDALADRDSFIGGLSLSPGTYFAAVSWYGKDAHAASQTGLTLAALGHSGNQVSGASPNSSFASAMCRNPSAPAAQCTGRYILNVRTSFVPEPKFSTAVSIGMLALCLMAGRGMRTAPRGQALC